MGDDGVATKSAGDCCCSSLGFVFWVRINFGFLG